MSNFINEQTVMQFYIDQIDAHQIIFLENKTELKAEIRQAISDLMQAQNMNSKINIACTLWKKLFEASMSTISSNKQGYDKLFKYFDAYVEFEELIFASDSFYRDHTLHCIWVYFLGEYIKRNEQYKPLFIDSEQTIITIKGLYEVLSTHDSFEELTDERVKRLCTVLSDLENLNEASRCVEALTHDLGYPLKKIEKINKSIAKVLPYYAIHQVNDFSFMYDNMQQDFVEQFVDFISHRFNVNTNAEKLSCQDRELLNNILSHIFIHNEFGSLKGINYEKVNNITQEEWDGIKNLVVIEQDYYAPLSTKQAYFNDFESYQHGIMSAFILAKNIPAFMDVEFSEKDDKLYLSNAAQVLALQEILSSISFHTCERMTIEELSNDNYLTFVDELEEFSRISRASQNREYVKEFCDTSLEMDDEGWFNIDFVFSNTNLDNLDPERAFKGRCKRFLSLFNVPHLSPNLKLRVRCIGQLETDQNVYTLEIARKHALVTINDEQMNIPKYLKSSEYFTTEEYANM